MIHALTGLLVVASLYFAGAAAFLAFCFAASWLGHLLHG